MFHDFRQDKQRLLILLLLCASTLAGCLRQFDSNEDATTMVPHSAETIASLSRLIDDALAQKRIPGAIVGIWQNGYEPLLLTAGKADLASGRKPSSQDHFRMASNSKMFTATALLILADEGKLGLDDTVSVYLPNAPYADQITVRQLANHTSGLYNFTDDADFWRVVADDPLKKWAPEELLAKTRQMPLDFSPGSKFNYSNSGYIVMGQLIEKISGMTWERFVTDRILSPLRLLHTSCPANSVMPEPFIRGYDNDGQEMSEVFVDPSIAGAAGSMITTVSDFKLWLDALRTDALLSPAMGAERRRFVPMGSDPDMSYGFGCMNIGNTFLGHTGMIPGYNSVALTAFDGSKTVIVLMNGSSAETDILTEIFRILPK